MEEVVKVVKKRRPRKPKPLEERKCDENGKQIAFAWTNLQLQRLAWVKDAIAELEEYRPLTVRQVYYNIIGKGLAENIPYTYTCVGKVISEGRLAGFVPWDLFIDRGRIFNSHDGWDNAEQFMDYTVDSFLSGYQRDLSQSQPVYVEVWVEKDALATIVNEVAEPYYVPTVICRGNTSVTFLNDFRNRVNSRAKGRPVSLLFLSDLDPSGVGMLPAAQEKLEKMGVTSVTFKRLGLLPEQVEKYNLPVNPDAIKEKDKNASKFRKLYGETAVELDALKPTVLQGLIRQAIEAEFDMDLFEKEKQANLEDISLLEEKREQVLDYLDSIM